MDDGELARAVASDLGPEVAAAVENPSVARGLPEAMAVGGFVLSCAQLACQIWSARQERALLVEALANSDELLTKYPQLDPEKRMGLMARVLEKFLPDTFGRPPHDHSEVATADKRNWVRDYEEAARPPSDRIVNLGEAYIKAAALSSCRSLTRTGGSSARTSAGSQMHRTDPVLCVSTCRGAS